MNNTLNQPNEPPDWQIRWNEPLEWPKAKVTAGDAERAHREYRPDLAESGIVLIDIDKKSLDQKIAEFGDRDAAVGKAFGERVYGTVLPNVIALLGFFRGIGRPVVHVRWGWHRYPYTPLIALPGEAVVIKKSRGAFATSDLETVLRERGIKTCLYTGADTAFCVASTVREGIDRGFRAVLVEDACVSAHQRQHENVMQALGWGQANILSTAEILSLLPQ